MKPAGVPMKWYFMGAPDKLGLAGTYGSKIDAHFTYVLFLASSFHHPTVMDSQGCR